MKNLEKSEFYNEWEKMVLDLKEHIHRKRIQASAYNACKIDLAPGEALIHIDYSESYENKQQHEIQSAYFGQSTFSLFTACIYHLDSIGDLVKRPITVVSESSGHSRIAALTCIDFVIKEAEKYMKLTKAKIWSDGCAAQFRSRFVFKLLSTYRPDLLIDWHYNEAHHGKGPMERSVAQLKMWCSVMSSLDGSLERNLSKPLTFCPSITTLFQRSDAILSELIDIEEAPIIPGILKIHNLKRSNQTATVKSKLISFFFQTAKNLALRKYIQLKSNADTWTVILILLHNLEALGLTVWDNIWMFMKPKRG